MFRNKVIIGLSRVVIMAFFVLLTGCEKEVNIKLQSSPSQLVVQGVVENDIPPYVILNTTFGFFSKVDLSTLQNSFVHNAVVTVYNGTKTVTLKEYSVDTAGGNKFFIYTIDTTNLSGIMVGELGKFYTLNISYNGKTYASVTKIHILKDWTHCGFGEPVFKRATTPASALELFGNYTDPDTMGNYVKYFTNRNNEGFYPAGVFTDELVNGKPINSIDLFSGTANDNSSDDNSDSAYYFYPGDSVVVKWSEIDKGVYDFWNTYEFSIRSGGNPFSSPINVKSNISNGALGAWAGYGSLYYRLMAH